jgi:ubiquinone/menaquinone biosynthesis C-methylase UbiE
MADQAFDEAQAEAFAGRMMEMLNSASLALMTSIGHKVGLFDTMAASPGATTPQIAGSAGLHERYVREWLGAMVTGGIVRHDAAGGTFTLPAEHAAFLTREAGPNNIAIQTQYIPLLAQVETQLVESFRNGGGVPYSEFAEFQRLMAEDSAAIHDASLLEATLPLVPGLTDRLEAGIDVLDVGCGSGHALVLMGKTFPKSRFTGYDFAKDGVEAGREEAERLGLGNVRFEQKDVSQFDETQAYDLITAFDAIHDQAQPARVLDNIFRALRSDGVFLMVDVGSSSHLHENIDHPVGPFIYTFSTMHCMTVSLALDGAGLGAMWGEQQALQMLSDAGFTDVEVARIDGDFLNNYYIARKSAQA